MDLVTGASGFLGNVLVKELLLRGRKVRVLLRKSSNTEPLSNLDVDICYGNVLDYDSICSALKNIENVYHAACFVALLPSDKKNIIDININGTKNIIKACFRMNIKRLIYTSSIHALESSSSGTLIDENIPFGIGKDRHPYDYSKALSSIKVIEAYRKGLDAVVVCPTGLIGPFDYNITSMSQFFLDYMDKKFFLKIAGAYDFVDVRDAANGHILAAEKGRSGQVYILSGQRVTTDELFHLLEKNTSIKSPKYNMPINIAKMASAFVPVIYKFKKTKPCFTKYSICTLQSNSNISHKKAYDELGYRPRPVEVSVSDGIKWLKSKKHPDYSSIKKNNYN